MARAPPFPRVRGSRRTAKESAERGFREKQLLAHLWESSGILKRKSDAMEESNALLLFGVGLAEQTAENVPQRDVFLRNLREKHGARCSALRRRFFYLGTPVPDAAFRPRAGTPHVYLSIRVLVSHPTFIRAIPHVHPWPTTSFHGCRAPLFN